MVLCLRSCYGIIPTSDKALEQGGRRTAEMATNDAKMGWNYNAYVAGIERGRGLGAREKKGRGLSPRLG